MSISGLPPHSRQSPEPSHTMHVFMGSSCGATVDALSTEAPPPSVADTAPKSFSLFVICSYPSSGSTSRPTHGTASLTRLLFDPPLLEVDFSFRVFQTHPPTHEKLNLGVDVLLLHVIV